MFVMSDYFYKGVVIFYFIINLSKIVLNHQGYVPHFKVS